MLLLLFVCINILTVYGQYCSNNYQYIIRSAGPGGLVLDGAEDTHLKLQYFTGYKSQLWYFEFASEPGLFYIRNGNSGKVLDVYTNQQVYSNTRSESLSQQWYINAEGRIQNAWNSLNLDVTDKKFVAGTVIQVWTNNGFSAQQFALQKVTLLRNGLAVLDG